MHACFPSICKRPYPRDQLAVPHCKAYARSSTSLVPFLQLGFAAEMDAHDLDQEPQPSAFLIPLISAAVHGNHQALVAELEGMPPKSDYVQEHCVEVLAALFKTHKQCSLQGLCRTLTLILQKGEVDNC